MEVVNVNSLACKNEDAIYFKASENDFRTPFSRDVDRILYSLSNMYQVEEHLNT